MHRRSDAMEEAAARDSSRFLPIEDKARAYFTACGFTSWSKLVEAATPQQQQQQQRQQQADAVEAGGASTGNASAAGDQSSPKRRTSKKAKVG